MIKELLDKLRYGVAVTEGESALYRKWVRENLEGFNTIGYTIKMFGIDRVSLIASIMGRETKMYERIKELEQKVEELENKECPFSPPRNPIRPENEPPEINKEQYYFYDYYGNDWYLRTFYLGATNYLRMKEAPPVQQWINIYPLPQDTDYENEFDKK